MNSVGLGVRGIRIQLEGTFGTVLQKRMAMQMSMMMDTRQRLLDVWPLRFRDSAMEQRYLDSTRRYMRMQIGIALVLAGCLYVIYSHIDKAVAPQEFLTKIHGFHLYVLAPLLAIGGAIVIVTEKFNVSHHFEPLFIFCVIAAPIFAAAGNLLILRAPEQVPYYLAEVYMITIWTLTVSGLRVTHAAMAGAVVAAMGLVVPMWILSFPDSLLPLNFFHMLTAYALGLSSCYMAERAKRISYTNYERMHNEVKLRIQTEEKQKSLLADLQLAKGEVDMANERMSRDLATAARVQQALLPNNIMEVEGVDLLWHYQPSSELAGDGLNVFRLDDEHIAMYVLDVSGHGVASALLSVSITHHLSQISSGRTSVNSESGIDTHILFSPKDLASCLNRAFPMEAVGQHYFTFVYGVLNVRSGRFCFVSAGSPGPVVIHSDGSSDIYDAPAVPLGMFGDSEYENTEIDLVRGDRMYLYSDGLYEQRHQTTRDEFGRKRMANQLSSAASHPFVASTDDLLEAITEWRGDDNLSDDIAILGCALTTNSTYSARAAIA